MSAARQCTSQITVGDGKTTNYETSRPKSSRMSVCARATAESTANRQKAAIKSKASSALPKGKLEADRTQAIPGTTSRVHVKDATRTAEEKVRDQALKSATNDATSSRSEFRTKSTTVESDGVIFDKKKRQSYSTTTMRNSKQDKSTLQNASEQSDNERKTFTQRNQSSTVFAGPSNSIEHRPLRQVNIKNDSVKVTPSVKTAAEEKTYAAYNAASEDSENNRHAYHSRNTSSTVFSSGPIQDTSGGRVHFTKSNNNIFGGGAFADDAQRNNMPKPRASAAPVMNTAMERPASARAMRDAQLRGSGSLW
mmetsp:Transcript_34877/g.54514  ORF Transcript_34877/g.54514 Transcript_34877/m.54514 type:complete len:309 (+) Transcript_34877:182-1108(+)|eukprot:CAMPEP_0184288436 /NCGR_PEP_ID=MMETSP1049-20130417/960_1 /TAXON_ID=77928 /ORGANISM="Proteomonas sulcata, Strain CCMP704" /LENGTH=308 /DNA_ID=CAMNT_0026594831 /DNA_START=182 /DNA_END=1108 /DNA_ORIENTATION=-